jgi:hypothetical protein
MSGRSHLFEGGAKIERGCITERAFEAALRFGPEWTGLGDKGFPGSRQCYGTAALILLGHV